MIIGERLKIARNNRGLSQSALARKAGITPSAISQIEAGLTKKPSSENLLPLASALNIDPNWLITGKGSPSPVPLTTSPNIAANEPAAIYGGLTPDERALLDKYRQMSEAQKTTAQTVVDALAQPNLKQSNE